MRAPFKTDQDLLDSLAPLSEAVRIDYCRRVDQANLAAHCAFLDKDLAQQIEIQISSTRSQVKKVNLGAIALLAAIGLLTLIAELPYGRPAALFIAGTWAIYLIATETVHLPQLALQQAMHWNNYQKRAREWSTLLGDRGFAEHLKVAESRFRGSEPDDAELVDLAVRGFALVQAARVAQR